LATVAAVDLVTEFLERLPGESRRLAHAEWGLTVPAEAAAGWPLDVGLSLVNGLLTVKAAALEDPGELDPWMLLWWNRQTRYIRFSATRSREIWVHADTPAAALDERELDRVMGLVVEGAVAVRRAQAA
jgi:hypothetical protein